jgi:hypothetical protein
MVKSNKGVGTEYYDTIMTTSSRGSEMRLEELLMQTIPTLQGRRPHFNILKFASFLLTRKKLTENCLGQSKDLGSDGAIKKAFVMMTGTDLATTRMPRMFTNPRGFNTRDQQNGDRNRDLYSSFLKVREPGNLAVC